MTRTLKPEIDIQNIFYCLTVLVIHLLSGPLADLPYMGFWYNVCFYIQRPMFAAVFGFIFLSAQKSFLTSNKTSIWSYYAKRIKSIIIPYIVAVFATWLVFYKNEGILMFPKLLLNGRAGAQFYFVLVISQFYLLVPLLKRIINKINIKTILIVSFIINLLTVLFFSTNDFCDRIFLRYIFCYSLGIIAGVYYSEFNSFILKHKLLITLMFFITLAGELAGVSSYISGKISYTAQQLISMLYMPCAVLFFVLLAKKASEFIKPRKFLNAINKNSYHIFLWHVLVLTMTEWYMKGAGILRVSHLFIGKTASLILLIAFITLIRSKRR